MEKIAIKCSDSFCGQKLIDALIKRGGINKQHLNGDIVNYYYYINDQGTIICDGFLPKSYKQINDPSESEDPQYGELVEVSDNGYVWQKRTFCTKTNDNKFMCNAYYGNIENNYMDEGVRNVKIWKYCRKIKKNVYEPKKLQLNSEYTAVIHKDEVKVNCQKFTFNKIKELCELIEEAENFKEE
jgi:hypothetical protein